MKEEYLEQLIKKRFEAEDKKRCNMKLSEFINEGYHQLYLNRDIENIETEEYATLTEITNKFLKRIDKYKDLNLLTENEEVILTLPKLFNEVHPVSDGYSDIFVKVDKFISTGRPDYVAMAEQALVSAVLDSQELTPDKIMKFKQDYKTVVDKFYETLAKVTTDTNKEAEPTPKNDVKVDTIDIDYFS